MSKKLYDTVERTDALGTTTWIRWNDVRTALKLQELVKGRIEKLEPIQNEYEKLGLLGLSPLEAITIVNQLQSLVKESQMIK